MSMNPTGDFFRELCARGGGEDRAFMDAREIASALGMNDTDLVATLQSLETGNLIEEFDRAGGIEVRLTEFGRQQCVRVAPAV